MQTILDQVIELIQEIAEKELPENITEETQFMEDLQFDSIMLIQMLVAAEERFGFDSTESEEGLLAFRTVGDFVKFVEKYVER